MWRVIVRFSLQGDAGSKIRNQLGGILEPAGVINTKTGSWETEVGDETLVSEAIGKIFRVIKDNSTIVPLDHIWIYVDNPDESKGAAAKQEPPIEDGQ